MLRTAAAPNSPGRAESSIASLSVLFSGALTLCSSLGLLKPRPSAYAHSTTFLAHILVPIVNLLD